jgi:hypothetical protein
VAAIFVGFALSPYLSWGVALTVIIAYYLVAIASHLQLETLGTYEITLSGVGPTEGRLLLMACNAALALDLLPSPRPAFPQIETLDPLALAVAASMIVLSGLRALSNLRTLAAHEPPNRVRVRVHVGPLRAASTSKQET